MKKVLSIISFLLCNIAVFLAAECLIDLLRNSANQPKPSGVLCIEPLVTVADLLIAIGLIGLGLSILATIITIEVCYFRGGKHEGKRCSKDHGERSSVCKDRIAERIAALRVGDQD